MAAGGWSVVERDGKLRLVPGTAEDAIAWTAGDKADGHALLAQEHTKRYGPVAAPK